MFKEFPELLGGVDIGREELNAILVELEQFKLPEDRSLVLFAAGIEDNLYIRLTHQQEFTKFDHETNLDGLKNSLIAHRKRIAEYGKGRPWFSLELWCYPTHPSSVAIHYEFNPLDLIIPTYEELLVELLQYPRELSALPEWYRTALQLNE